MSVLIAVSRRIAVGQSGQLSRMPTPSRVSVPVGLVQEWGLISPSFWGWVESLPLSRWYYHSQNHSSFDSFSPVASNLGFVVVCDVKMSIVEEGQGKERNFFVPGIGPIFSGIQRERERERKPSGPWVERTVQGSCGHRSQCMQQDDAALFSLDNKF